MSFKQTLFFVEDEDPLVDTCSSRTSRTSVEDLTGVPATGVSTSVLRLSSLVRVSGVVTLR